MCARLKHCAALLYNLTGTGREVNGPTTTKPLLQERQGTEAGKQRMLGNPRESLESQGSGTELLQDPPAVTAKPTQGGLGS